MNQNNFNDNILPLQSFSESIAKGIDIAVDFTENNIDELLDNQVLKSIPIIKTILAGTNVVVTINQRHQIKKMLIFMQNLESHKNDSSVIKMKNKILSDPYYLQKETELSLIVLDKIVEAKKAKLLAAAFYLLVSEKITSDEYMEIALIVEQIYYNDLSVLNLISNGNPNSIHKRDIANINRLNATGAIYQNVIDGNGIAIIIIR